MNDSFINICKNCGNTTNNRVHCSTKCSNEYRNKPAIKPCKKCGQEVNTTNGNNKPTCDKCRKTIPIEIRELVRYNIFKRDDFRCVYCGMSSIEDGISLHLEHVIPEYTDINNTVTNIVTSCSSCNFSKGSFELPKDVVERITNRNKKLNIMFTDDEINFMNKFFSEYYIVRNSNPNPNPNLNK